MAGRLWSDLKLSPVLKSMEPLSEGWCDLIVEASGNPWDKVVGFVESEQGTVSRVMKLVPAIEVKLPAAAVAGLAGLPFVRRVWSNTVVKPLSSSSIRPVIPWLPREGATGKGVIVAVLDTGIRPWFGLDYPEERLIGWTDIVNGRETAYDDHGHGTYLARIIAGNGPGSGGAGIAPEARLVGVKVLNRQATGTLADLLLGLEWCLENQPDPIRVMSVPLKTLAQGNYHQDLLCRALTLAKQQGVAVCTGLEWNGEPGRQIADSPGMHPRLLVAVNSEWPVNRRIGRIAVPDPDRPLLFGKPADLSAAAGYISGMAARILEEQPSVSPEKLRQAVARQIWLEKPSNLRGRKSSDPALDDSVRLRIQALADQAITYLNRIDLSKLLKRIEFYQDSELNEWLKVAIALIKALKIGRAWERLLRNSMIPELIRTGLELLQEQVARAGSEPGSDEGAPLNHGLNPAGLLETMLSGIQPAGDGLDSELQTIVTKLLQWLSPPEPAPE